MSVYRQDAAVDTRYGKKDRRNIDVLVPHNVDYHGFYDGATAGYLRGEENLYARETEVRIGVGADDGDEEGVAAASAWDRFEEYPSRSEPAKIHRWTALMRREEGGAAAAGSCLNGRGELEDSFDALIRSMPDEALDATVTVQAKPMMRRSSASRTSTARWSRRCSSPCGICAGDNDRDGEEARPSDKEIMSHNLRMADSRLTVAPYEVGDEDNLFLGQEGQVTTSKRLREVMTGATEGMNVCLAQVNIYSREESGSTATVDDSGRTSTVGGNETRNASPLAALLPWLRLPSLLLPTDGGIEIREVNFWMCPRECRTNTHYDGHHNLLMVLHGAKTVELSPPGAIRGSPVHGDHANHPFVLRCAQVDGHLINDNFAYELGPNGPYRDACRNNIVVSVAAGEAVFIPEGWWHRVESSDNCVAVNVWFVHANSSLSTIARDDNPHQLPYQARETVRRYVAANIEDANEARRKESRARAFGRPRFGEATGGGSGRRLGRRRDPGRAMRRLLEAMNVSRAVPQERTNEEVVNGMAAIEHHARRLFGALNAGESSGPGRVESLRRLALPRATEYLGNMISAFVIILDPGEQRDRIAMMQLFERFPPVTLHHQRRMFTSIVTSLSRGACHVLSVAWEKHGSPVEAEASYNSLFGRCAGDEGRKYFLKEVDEFANESARKLILGDLMLLNPTPDARG